MPRNTPVWFTASTSFHDLGDVSTMRSQRRMPALLTRMSSRPCASTTRVTSAVHWSGSVTSCSTNVPPSPAAVFSPSSVTTSVTNTVAPSSAARRFDVDRDAEADWAGSWKAYLEGYADFCGVPSDRLEEVHRHLDSEFADAARWYREAPGCREGLAALAATGVRLGIVSNADGMIGERLRTR